MKTISSVFFILMACSLSAQADNSSPFLTCQSTGPQLEITEVRMQSTPDGLYRADISVYNKFSHVTNPPPITRTYLEVGRWKQQYLKNDSGGYFQLIASGAQSHLNTDTINLDMTCAYNQESTLSLQQIDTEGIAESYGVTPETEPALVQDAEDDALTKAHAACGKNAAPTGDFNIIKTRGCAQFLHVEAKNTFNCVD